MRIYLIILYNIVFTINCLRTFKYVCLDVCNTKFVLQSSFDNSNFKEGKN